MRAVRWLCGSIVLGLPFAVAAAQGSDSTIKTAVSDTVHGRPLVAVKVTATKAGRDSIGAPNAAALRDEFDQRVKVHAGGQYITEEIIARTRPWRTTDLLRHVSGFEFRRDTVFSTRGQYEIGGRGACKPVLLIDGHPADTMNEVLPVAIHGIEIYPSSLGVPQKYPFSACGAIFIWTK